MALSKSEAGKLGAKKLKENLLKKYDENPSKCHECGSVMPYDKRRNKFCSSSCSATHNNKKRESKIPTLICEHCKTHFKPSNGSTGKYCSTNCANEHRNDKLFEKVKNGTASPRTVKRYLIETHGNVCMDPDCAWDFEKRPINVELEHKDGDASNNTLDNCVLLCPNCHSLTSTYKNRNKGNGRHKRRERYAKGKSY